MLVTWSDNKFSLVVISTYILYLSIILINLLALISCVFSTMTTASAPGGTGAPVFIRIISPVPKYKKTSWLLLYMTFILNTYTIKLFFAISCPVQLLLIIFRCTLVPTPFFHSFIFYFITATKRANFSTVIFLC